MGETHNCQEAFVTLATNDCYCQGAIVLAYSLRKHGTKKQLVVMITPQVSHALCLKLEAHFDRVVLVDVMDSEDEAHLSLLKRPELGITFTKIHCWNLTGYKKCVFMDADTMALTNIDELFEREELSAAPDAGWPDMFNSGVFVYRPSHDTYMSLLTLANVEGSFDGGDQGLLNTYFGSWDKSDPSKRLSFLYNMHSTATYTYSPAFVRFGKDTKVVHFIGSVKPWHHKYDYETDVLHQTAGPGMHEEEFLRCWWRLFHESFNKVGELEQKVTYISISSPVRSMPSSAVVDTASIFNNQATFQERKPVKSHETSNVGGAEEHNFFVTIPLKMDDILPGRSLTTDHVTSPTPISESTLCQSTPSGDEIPRNEAREEVSEGGLSEEEKEESLLPRPANEKHFRLWRDGTADYQGHDSFANIQARIDQMLIYAEFGITGASGKSKTDKVEPTAKSGVSNVNVKDSKKKTSLETNLSELQLSEKSKTDKVEPTAKSGVSNVNVKDSKKKTSLETNLSELQLSEKSLTQREEAENKGSLDSQLPQEKTSEIKKKEKQPVGKKKE